MQFSFVIYLFILNFFLLIWCVVVVIKYVPAASERSHISLPKLDSVRSQRALDCLFCQIYKEF